MASDSSGVGSLLPSQAGQASGNILTTDGFTASWEAVPAGAGVTTVGTFGSTPTANAATISGVSIFFQPADATHPGSVTTAAQAFGGAKTFSSGVIANVTAAASSTEVITGNVADGATAVGVTLNNSVTLADASSRIFRAQNNGTTKASVDFNGTLFLNVGTGQPVILGQESGGNCGLWFGVNGGSQSVANYNIIGGATATVINAGGSTISFRVSNANKMVMSATGQLDMSSGGQTLKLAYTDTSGTPGAGTASTPTGRSAIVSGSGAAFDITNTLVSATSVVMITNEDADATGFPIKVVPGTGKFTVTPAAAATGSSKFRWVVFN